jgi:capsular polysaccharide biosynthesis protein
MMNPVDADRWPALLESLSAPDPEEARLPISQYLWIVKRHRWRILGFCAAAVIATVIISARLTPIFESTTTVDVDRQSPSGVVGQDAARSVTNDADQFLATQMKLVQSDGVLRPVDSRFRLRQREGQSAASSPAGEAAPIVLKLLRVTRPPNTYLMLVSYRSDDPQLAADAANAIAESYLEHSYSMLRMAAVEPSLIPAPCAPKRPSGPASIGFSSRIPYELATSRTWLATTGARLIFHWRYAAWSFSSRATRRADDSTESAGSGAG